MSACLPLNRSEILLNMLENFDPFWALKYTVPQYTILWACALGVQDFCAETPSGGWPDLLV